MVDSNGSTAVPQQGDGLAALIGRIAGGDAPSLEDLYTRTSAKLYGIAVRLLGNDAEAEEVVQDVYLTVWRKAPLFDASKASPITWLSVLVRNRAIDRIRRRRGVQVPASEAENVADDTASAFDIAVQAQAGRRLHLCLDQLDEQPRTMIRSAFIDGLSYADLAERESVPLGTMKSWIRRGLQKLRACLDQ